MDKLEEARYRESAMLLDGLGYGDEARKQPTIHGWGLLLHEEQKIPCEVYSRVCGYWAHVRNWNQGKRQEWAERKEYEVPDASN